MPFTSRLTYDQAKGREGNKAPDRRFSLVCLIMSSDCSYFCKFTTQRYRIIKTECKYTQMHVQHVGSNSLVRRQKRQQQYWVNTISNKFLDLKKITLQSQNWYLISTRKVVLSCQMMPLHQLPWRNDSVTGGKFNVPYQHSGPALQFELGKFTVFFPQPRKACIITGGL